MCFYIDIKYHLENLSSNFNVAINLPPNYRLPQGEVNGFSNPTLPVITNCSPNQLQFFKWGLVPHWTKNDESAKNISSMTLNAKIETVREKPSYRDTWKRQQRCLIPVSGFYEWRHEKKRKVKHIIKYKEICMLAGIWSQWHELYSFSILTTKATGIMKYIHNTKERMPLIIPKKYNEHWLIDGELQNTDCLQAEVVDK